MEVAFCRANIVVEVLSEGSRALDRVEKRKLYERSGVEEYWIADAETDTIEIHRRGGDVSAGVEGVVTSPRLPRFSLNVTAVFA